MSIWMYNNMLTLKEEQIYCILTQATCEEDGEIFKPDFRTLN